MNAQRPVLIGPKQGEKRPVDYYDKLTIRELSLLLHGMEVRTEEIREHARRRSQLN